MSGPEAWILFAVMGVVTFGLRASFLVAATRRPVPPWLRRGLDAVPPAVLASLVAPMIAQPSGVTLGVVDVRIAVAVAAAVVAWRTRSVVVTLAFGMTGLFVMQALAQRST